MNNPVKFEAQKIKNFQKIKFKGKIDNKNLIYLLRYSHSAVPIIAQFYHIFIIEFEHFNPQVQFADFICKTNKSELTNCALSAVRRFHSLFYSGWQNNTIHIILKHRG